MNRVIRAAIRDWDFQMVRTVERMPPDAVLPVDRFVEAFVAGLVAEGVHQIAPKAPATRKGLRAVVELLDEQIRNFEAEGLDSARLWPWVQTVNRLRLSSLNGVENWEHQLRAAQRVHTRVPNFTYEHVDLAIDPITAVGELKKLNDDQLSLIKAAVRRYRSESAAA